MRLRLPSSAAPAAALLLSWIALAPATASAEEPAQILILPIVVHSGAVDSSHVSSGLSDMIASRLEQSGSMRVERPEDPDLATSRIGDALREGRARGADFVVFGAFTQFGDGASLDLQCIPARGASDEEVAAARRIFIQSGAVGDIIPRLDEIAGRLAAYVHARSPGSTPGAGVEPTAVASPLPAAPAPGDADDALRDIAERLEALEEAVFGSGDASAAANLGGSTPPES